MEQNQCEALTKTYCLRAAGVWAMLEGGFPLREVFSLLEAVKSPERKPLEGRADFLDLQERLESRGCPPSMYEPGQKQETQNVILPVPLEEALRAAMHLVILGEPVQSCRCVFSAPLLFLQRAAFPSPSEATSSPLSGDGIADSRSLGRGQGESSLHGLHGA